ncbi:MAG: type III pantothenate kinase [Muribaculaceae bacterium]|nr:type III pantothenate kinase [Muribaculaceae bacterium]
MSGDKGFLAIDCGNTRIKAVWFSSAVNSDPEIRYFSSRDSEGLIDWIEELKKKEELSGALSVVGNIDTRLTESLRHTLRERFLALTPATSLPISLGYRTPQTLGMDRKATACAAAARYPGEKIIVIDAGTAVTIDLITPEGVFEGGNISPGLRLRFRSLNEFTARLPLIEEADRYIPAFGFDTPSAIRAGVIGGWIDEMAAVAVRESSAGKVRIILTGGDSELAVEMLSERIRNLNPGCQNNIEIEHIPHLLAEGMRVIYRHHETEI